MGMSSPSSWGPSLLSHSRQRKTNSAIEEECASDSNYVAVVGQNGSNSKWKGLLKQHMLNLWQHMVMAMLLQVPIHSFKLEGGVTNWWWAYNLEQFLPPTKRKEKVLLLSCLAPRDTKDSCQDTDTNRMLPLLPL